MMQQTGKCRVSSPLASVWHYNPVSDIVVGDLHHPQGKGAVMR